MLLREINFYFNSCLVRNESFSSSGGGGVKKCVCLVEEMMLMVFMC